MKQIILPDEVAGRLGCNELENPIGIETKNNCKKWNLCFSRCNELENPIGIETALEDEEEHTYPGCCNELENPIGIETR